MHSLQTLKAFEEGRAKPNRQTNADLGRPAPRPLTVTPREWACSIVREILAENADPCDTFHEVLNEERVAALTLLLER